MKKKIVILSALILSLLILAVSACNKSEPAESVDPSLYERDATADDRVFKKTHAVYDGSFKSILTDEEKVIYEALEQNVIVKPKSGFSLDIRDMGFTIEEDEQLQYLVNIASYAFFEDHPEVFWIDLPWGTGRRGAQFITHVDFQIPSSFMGAFRQKETVENNIATAVNEIRSKRASESRYDTVKAIHDYVCENLSYHYSDSVEHEQQTCAPIFGGGSIGKEAVCEGYSKSFKVLCDQFDIPAAVIGSRSHGFNYVQMEDGCYYVVDCTYDDQDGWKPRYDYFLIGARTVITYFARYNSEPSAFILNEDFDHSEYWYYFNAKVFWPFVYPEVSEQAYSSIELLSEEPDPYKALSGDVTFRFRYNGNDLKDQKAKIYNLDVLSGTAEIDKNGLFEVTCDTTLLRNGENRLEVKVGDASFARCFLVNNKQFDILDWGDEIKSVTEPFEVRVKGYSTGNITDCKISVSLDTWEGLHGGLSGINNYGTYQFNKDGIASFVIDPKKCGEGLHNIRLFFQRPGSNNSGKDIENSESRLFRVSFTAADSGNMRFWGNSARSDRVVGEWADFTLKYDGRVTENCVFEVTIDGKQATPLRQGGEKITDFFDSDGYCTFYLDVNGQIDGTHRIRATLTREDGSSVSAENTVNVSDSYFTYELRKYDSENQLVKYTDRNDVIDGYVNIKLYNTSGQPSENCRFTYSEDDMIVCDRMMKEELTETFWGEGEYEVELSEPDLHYGAHVLKIVMQTPDGTYIEKSLPFRLQAAPRFYDDLYFSDICSDGVRNVGHTVDFTLNFDTIILNCKELSVTVDGNPADVNIPDNPASLFDHFGRFFFTLDFPDDQTGEHTVKAVLTKSNGARLIAEQKINVTDDYFEVINWPGENPTLNRVYDVKVKRNVDTGDPEDKFNYQSSIVRQFIDGEHMGFVSLDGEDGTGTLGLNTAGLEKGEHLYKLIFRYNNGKTVERLMRFSVD